MKSCLFVIDVQQSFNQQSYFDKNFAHAYLQQQNTLIEHCVKHHIPIVRVFHTDNDDGFGRDSGYVVPMQGLADFQESLCVYKTRHSALIDTILPVWLVEQGIGHIIISGIRTEQCCETTTRHASDLGYKVTYVLDATLTFDMQNADGSIFTAEAIKQRTQTVLQNRFATVVNTANFINSELAIGQPI